METSFNQHYSPIWTYYLILIISIQILSPLAQDLYCNIAKECVGNTTIHSAQVYANGYKSLSGPTTSITTSSILCYGSYSCHDISFMSSSNYIYCRGSNACSHIDASSSQYFQLTVSNAYIYCGGANSCAYSNLKTTPALNLSSIYCYGADSCANTNITGVSDIYAYGAYSLYQTTIDSSGITNTAVMTVTLFGYHAGFGGTIICHENDRCIINCYVNACEMLYINCPGDCTINTNSIQTISPINNLADFDGSTLNFFLDSSTLTANNDAICSLQLSTNNVFDDYIQHQYGADIVVTDANAGPICCRGAWSCTGVNNIQLNTITHHAVVCSGLMSCMDTTITNNHGSIFCEGAWSCYTAIMFTNIVNNVYCLGSRSCQNAQITGARNIYCTGRRACSNAVVTSGGDVNVYLLGEISAIGTDIYCHGGAHCFIFCGGSDACSDATRLFCDGTCEIECNFDSGCPLIYSSFSPTRAPTSSPTELTLNPSISPTQNPTEVTLKPSNVPTQNPTDLTLNPTINPTLKPSSFPTKKPTILTVNPSMNVTVLLGINGPQSAGEYVYWVIGGVLFIVVAIIIAVFVCFGVPFRKITKTNETKVENEAKSTSERTDHLQAEMIKKENDYKKINIKSDSEVNVLNNDNTEVNIVMEFAPPPPQIQSIPQIPPASKWMIETIGGHGHGHGHVTGGNMVVNLNDSDSFSSDVNNSENRFFEGKTAGGQMINVHVNHSASFSSELGQINPKHMTNKYSYYQ